MRPAAAAPAPPAKANASLARPVIASPSSSSSCSSSSFDVELGRGAYRAVWLSFFLLHATHWLAYLYGMQQYLKTMLHDNWVNVLLPMLGHAPLGANVRLFVITTSSLLSLCHFVALVHMLNASASTRQLVFATRDKATVGSAPRRRVSVTKSFTKALPWVGRFFASFERSWNRFLSPGSPYFEVVFTTREAVEIACQVAMVVRLTTMVGASWRTHVAVGAVVLNCWATPLVRFAWRHDPRQARALALCADISLSVFFTFLLPFFLYRNYIVTLDRHRLGTSWYDPAWIVDTGSVLRNFLNDTWGTAIVSRFTGITLLLGMDSAKAIIKPPPSKTTVEAINGPTATQTQQSKSGAMVAGIEDYGQAPTASFRLTSQLWRLVSQRVTPAGPHTASGRVQGWQPSHRVVDTAFVIFGLMLLVIHGHAMDRSQVSTTADRPVCLLHRQPWLRDSISCAVAVVDCQRLPSRSGSAQEVEAALADLQPDALQALMLHHCSALEISAGVLKRFPFLVYLELYNVTLRDWPASAALSERVNPRLAHVVLVQVRNVSTLPLGLTAALNAPMETLTVYDSDLAELAATAAKGWRKPMRKLVFERCQFTASGVPELFLVQDATIMSLASNSISVVPPTFLQGRDGSPREWHLLSFSENPIVRWPADPAFYATRLYVERTKLQGIPDRWFSHPKGLPELRTTATLPISAGVWAAGTRICGPSADGAYGGLLRCSLTDSERAAGQFPIQVFREARISSVD
ncbi:hypothetical protein P43SY_002144 [Pythium insidiosum]|uniref:Transmembrane protein n=1 Tax=Pythium insidiosum TaxID=114742 RepID=A0AAD5M8G7_PYTIN|nr:hypothetical protein P43SY_002144 [Pythium insidiosum]